MLVHHPDRLDYPRWLRKEPAMGFIGDALSTTVGFLLAIGIIDGARQLVRVIKRALAVRRRKMEARQQRLARTELADYPRVNSNPEPAETRL